MRHSAVTEAATVPRGTSGHVLGRAPARVPYLVAAIASTGGLLFGFNTAIISGALPIVQQRMDLGTDMSRALVAALLAGAVFGSLIAGLIADAFGRREVIAATAATFALGAFGSGLAPTVEWLIASRFGIGLAIGAVSVTVPLYIAEMAPAAERGFLVSFNQLAITIGILLAYVTAFVVGDHPDSWRRMFMAASGLAVLLGLSCILLVESPRWLVLQDDAEEARRILNALGRTPAEADDAIARVSRDLAQEAGLSWRDLFGARLGPAMLAGVGLFVFQQCVGINAILYFADSILSNAGFDVGKAAQIAAVVVGLLNVAFTLVAMALLDTVGRKKLLSVGFLGMSASLLAAGLVVLIGAGLGGMQKWLELLAILSFIAFFAVSIGPIGWLAISELYPTVLRGRAMSIPSAVHWLLNSAVSVAFLPLVGSVGAGQAFCLFAAVGAAGWLFCRRFVPETRGRTLEEIQEDFATYPAASADGVSR